MRRTMTGGPWGRLTALLLAAILCLTACGAPGQSADGEQSDAASTASAAPSPASSSAGDANEAAYQRAEDRIMADRNLDPGDEDLQAFLRDRIYTEAVERLGGDYVVESVQSRYYSREYLEQLESNSQENVYFGFTQSQLDQQFAGRKYVFTLDETTGETVPREVESYKDDTMETVVRNVLVGGGVLLFCVTASAATAGAVPALSSILVVGAKTGAEFALSGAAMGGLSAGIIEGYRTGSFDDALSAAAVSASEGFKWGAITGALVGGAKKAWGLGTATKGGLTMNEAAVIQRDSKYPLDVIKRFHSMKEYGVYKDAGLVPRQVDGRIALVQPIDLTRTSTLADGTKATNLERMKRGLAPLDKDGIPYELHHIGQEKDSTLAILTRAQHRGKGQPLQTGLFWFA